MYNFPQGFNGQPQGDAQSIEFAGGNPAGMRQPMGLGGFGQRPMPGQPGLGQLGNALGSNMWGRGNPNTEQHRGRSAPPPGMVWQNSPMGADGSMLQSGSYVPSPFAGQAPPGFRYDPRNDPRIAQQAATDQKTAQLAAGTYPQQLGDRLLGMQQPFQQGGFQPPGQMMPRPFEGSMGGAADQARFAQQALAQQAGMPRPGMPQPFGGSMGGAADQARFAQQALAQQGGVNTGFGTLGFGQPPQQPKQPGLFAGQPFAPRGGGQFQQMGSQNRRQWPGGSMY